MAADEVVELETYATPLLRAPPSPGAAWRRGASSQPLLGGGADASGRDHCRT